MKNRANVLIAALTGAAVAAVALLVWHFSQREAAPAPHVVPGKAYGAWILSCTAPVNGQKHCALSLRVVDKSRKHLRLAASVVADKNNAPRFVVVTPPDVNVAAGIRIAKDAKSAAVFGFEICTARFCSAGRALDAPLLALLEAGTPVTLHYAAANGRPFGFKLPTTHFGEGFAAWTAAEPKLSPH